MGGIVEGDAALITKGSVSYLSLIAKAYCREGPGSVTDFGAFSRRYDLGGGIILQLAFFYIHIIYIETNIYLYVYIYVCIYIYNYLY